MYNGLLTLGIKLLASRWIPKLLLGNPDVGRNKRSVSGVPIAGNTHPCYAGRAYSGLHLLYLR
jgi:hypothetical protein